MAPCLPFRWSEKGGFTLNNGQNRRVTTEPQPPRVTIRIIPDDEPPPIPTTPKPSVTNPPPPNIRRITEESSKSGTSDIEINEPPTNVARITVGALVGVGIVNNIEINPKRKAVINPPISVNKEDLQYEKYAKDESSASQIRAALMKNDFLKSMMDDDRLSAVVEAMRPQDCAAGTLIIREGESGSHLYVSANGKFEVLQKGNSLATFGAGEVFGELAILYKAKRFASIRCVTDSKVWSMERRVFLTIMVRSGQLEQEDNIRFLSSVPLLQKLDQTTLTNMTGFLKREFFSARTVIVRQGDRGDKFFIIRGGSVVVTKRDGNEEREVAILSRGKYFGEQALLHEDRRLATVTAMAPGVECLTLERKPFNEFLGTLDDLFKMIPSSPITGPPSTTFVKNITKVKSEFDFIQLSDLEGIGTLGVGGFGRVELVHYKKDKNLTFALKCLKKVDMVQQQQQEHAYNEKNIMMMCDSPFLCKLYRTYKDTKYIYFLMEPVLGGDLWTLLQKHRFFTEPVARFMAACVVEAFQYLHSKNVVYRDLKPENLMMDKHGYIKLVDFGFAKNIPPNGKTWTFAGTPEYVAPEIVLNKGHDRAVDCWALGVFIHELVVGKPPFRAPGGDHMKTYSLILRGIDLVNFHRFVKPIAQQLIRKLCRAVPSERLGYLKNGMADVKNHKWFNGFDWEKLRNRKLKAPLTQPVANNSDLSNFEKYTKEKLPPPDETSGWDMDF